MAAAEIILALDIRILPLAFGQREDLFS